MRFAITATDRYLDVFDAFVASGWTPVRLFTVPTDGRMCSNTAVVDRARKHGIGVQLSRMTERDLRGLHEDGCDLLVVASYQWHIPAWQAHVARAVNFHPSLLPDFRGPYPLVNGLLAGASRWGATCHKLAAAYDSGDILDQQAFDVSASETHETLDLRTQIATAAIARRVASNFEPLWAGARPQGAGSFAALVGDAQRTLDFGQTVEQILRTVRAFGRFECLATLHEVEFHIARAEGWQEAHDHAPGTMVHTHAMATVVACRDGYIAILEWQMLGPFAVTGTRLR